MKYEFPCTAMLKNYSLQSTECELFKTQYCFTFLFNYNDIYLILCLEDDQNNTTSLKNKIL